MQKTLGGDRLGSGNKQKVYLHGYERSTHDLGYLWRSTMSPGTLVPFLSEVALPGDTFDIKLGCDIKTHPTIGPLFGSYKVQLDVFQAPIRLYNSLLHNNALGIGLTMNVVKLPQITLDAYPMGIIPPKDMDNSQINPSCILSYLGIRGIGRNNDDTPHGRNFNAVPLLAYWDIYKNYYANKQEEIGAVIHTPIETITDTVTTVEILDGILVTATITQDPIITPVQLTQQDTTRQNIKISYSGILPPDLKVIIFNTIEQGQIAANDLIKNAHDTGTSWEGYYDAAKYGAALTILNWQYADYETLGQQEPQVVTFFLTNIDLMRTQILAHHSTITPFFINTFLNPPYDYLHLASTAGIPNILNSQEGLAVKTYQSDLFNNWLQTEWIDGVNGISAVTAIDTTAGEFTIDTLNLARKVYDMLNRIAVSGGSYDDWLDAVYTHDRYTRCETPMYMGGLSKELVFQEVVSNSQTPDQPLGTIAGKGVMTSKHKGGHITVKVDEPSYIIGLISLTPRLDYSQGNKWDTHLQTMDDLHKPALDEIGFQDLITEQMAWWDTAWDDVGAAWVTKSAGKQPAWLNYMTNVNQTRGNFAIPNNEMFMTLNRRYEKSIAPDEGITDLTTYIDPAKYNFIFAETSTDAQNFWAQISINMEARRKMSAKLMPNL